MKKLAVITFLAVAAAAVTVGAYRAHLVSGLKRPVLEAAVDPDSVRFRNLRVASDWTPTGSMLCGEVNARNRAGGYAGHQKFVVLGSGSVIADDDEMVETMCKVLDGPLPWWYAWR